MSLRSVFLMSAMLTAAEGKYVPAQAIASLLAGKSTETSFSSVGLAKGGSPRSNAPSMSSEDLSRLATKVSAQGNVERRKHLLAGALAAAALLAPRSALAGDIDAGEGVFGANCGSCHAGGANTVQAAKTLQKASLEQYLAGGYSEASIIKQVTNGKGQMPAFGAKLAESDIQNVAAYVYSQAANAKWDVDQED